MTALRKFKIFTIPWFFPFKDECYEALVSISRKINTNDADMRSHVVLSMFKVAAAEADVPPPPASAASKLFHMFNAGPGGSTGAVNLEVILLFNALIILIRNSNCQITLWRITTALADTNLIWKSQCPSLILRA